LKWVILACGIALAMACSEVRIFAQDNQDNQDIDFIAKETIMSDELMLAREWVEIREDSHEGRIVCRPVTYDIPPARGRRRLDLRDQGIAAEKRAAADDKLATQLGNWKVDENELTITAGGWSGTYRIEDLTDVLLVLVPIK